MQVAQKDPRVKSVFSFDPWVWAKNKDIMSGKLIIPQPQVHIITDGFIPVCEKHFFYNTEKSINALIDNSTSARKEMHVLKGCNHYHQADVICLVPLEAFIRSGNKPQLNVGDIYLLNTWVVLLFLNKIGFGDHFDVSPVQKRVDKMKKKFLEERIIEQNEEFN